MKSHPLIRLLDRGSTLFLVLLAAFAITIPVLNLLMPDRRNPRQHSPRQIRQISRSIEIFGFVVPILIDRNNYIVAGEGRYRASEYLGWL